MSAETSPDDRLSPDDLRELKTLRLREQRLGKLLENLGAGPGRYRLTQDDVALVADTTRDEVRRTERRALLKLRRRLFEMSPSPPSGNRPEGDF